jgi:hypothetical protein
MARRSLPICGLGEWFSGGRYYLVDRGRGNTDACLVLAGLVRDVDPWRGGVCGTTLTLVASRLVLSRTAGEVYADRIISRLAGGGDTGCDGVMDCPWVAVDGRTRSNAACPDAP